MFFLTVNFIVLGHSENKFSEPDLARSLLFTISNDIGQIACLYAMMHNLKKVILIRKGAIFSPFSFD